MAFEWMILNSSYFFCSIEEVDDDLGGFWNSLWLYYCKIIGSLYFAYCSFYNGPRSLNIFTVEMFFKYSKYAGCRPISLNCVLCIFNYEACRKQTKQMNDILKSFLNNQNLSEPIVFNFIYLFISSAYSSWYIINHTEIYN